MFINVRVTVSSLGHCALWLDRLRFHSQNPWHYQLPYRYHLLFVGL